MLTQLFKGICSGTNVVQNPSNDNESIGQEMTIAEWTVGDIERLEQKESLSLNSRLNNANNNTLSQEKVRKLNEMGFRLDTIFNCWKKYKFSSVEEAIYYLTGDHLNERESREEQLDIDYEQRNLERITCFEEHLSPIPNDFQESENKIIINRKNTTISTRRSFYQTKDDIIRKNQQIIKNLNIIDEDKNKELCTICYQNKISNLPKKFHYCCSHLYCENCLRKILTENIENGKVMNIKCPYPTCYRVFTDSDIQAIVSQEIFYKYRLFFGRKAKMLNIDQFAIHCPYPDCEEIIFIERTRPINQKLICPQGHKFCGKCKERTWHSGYNCKDYTDEILAKVIRSHNRYRYKLCPYCKVVIEKKIKDNKVECSNCKYKFCWLCLEKCGNAHFAIYNISGCYGKRYESEGGVNNCKKKCHFIGLGFLCFFSLMGVVIIYFIIGCSLEFIQLYLTSKVKKKNGLLNNDFEIMQVSQTIAVENHSSCVLFGQIIICILLFIAGLALQPIYLLLYIFLILINCMKIIGCGMFIFFSGR